MYLAELRGKLSDRIEKKEDILTSNVFSFFKYANRKAYLKSFLQNNGYRVSVEDSQNAQFIFWPNYDDRTEPDVVLIVGEHYILVEAKYRSDFGEETEFNRAQLIREIEGGQLEAKNLGK